MVLQSKQIIQRNPYSSSTSGMFHKLLSDLLIQKSCQVGDGRVVVSVSLALGFNKGFNMSSSGTIIQWKEITVFLTINTFQ